MNHYRAIFDMYPFENAILREDAPIISDPLAWQTAMDNAPAGINMRGSARFWATVETLSGLEVIYRDGAPEFTEIVFRLKGNIGLRLSTRRIDVSDYDADDKDIPAWIDFEFCEITDQVQP